MQDSILLFVGPLGFNKNVDDLLNGNAQIREDVRQAMSEVK